MRIYMAVATFVFLTSPAFSADFGTFLGKADADLSTDLANVASCTRGPHTIRIPIVTAQTKVRRDLFNPVSGNLIAADGSGEITYPAIQVTSCDIGSAAIVRGYSHAGKIFRISVIYTRCKKVAAAGNCLETDEEVHPYDKEIYSSLEHKDAYISSAEGSFYSDYHAILSDPVAKEYTYGLDCGPWVSDFTFNKDRTSKCIADISLKNGVLSATTVYEIYNKGYVRDTLFGRFVGQRLFVNVQEDQDAATELAASMTEVVQEQKDQISKSNAEKLANENQVNKILGSTPSK